MSCSVAVACRQRREHQRDLLNPPGGFACATMEGTEARVKLPRVAAAVANRRGAAQAHTVGDKMYLVGGLNSTGAVLSSIDMYDPVLDLFEAGSSFDSQHARQRYASGVIESRFYVAAGLAAADPDTGPHLVCIAFVVSVLSREQMVGCCSSS